MRHDEVLKRFSEGFDKELSIVIQDYETVRLRLHKDDESVTEWNTYCNRMHAYSVLAHQYERERLQEMKRK